MDVEKKQKSLEEVRVDARDRKRAQRERDSEFENKQRLASMDPGERRVHEIMTRIEQEPRQGQPPRPPEPPQPARLPTLQEWLKCLKQINTAAAQEERIRVEAAIAAGMTEISQYTRRSDATKTNI